MRGPRSEVDNCGHIVHSHNPLLLAVFAGVVKVAGQQHLKGHSLALQPYLGRMPESDSTNKDLFRQVWQQQQIHRSRSIKKADGSSSRSSEQWAQ